MIINNTNMITLRTSLLAAAARSMTPPPMRSEARLASDNG